MLLSAPKNMLRFIIRRLNEPNGWQNLLNEVQCSIQKTGIKGLLTEIRGVAGSPQRPIRANQLYANWVANYEFSPINGRKSLTQRLEKLHVRQRFSIFLKVSPEEGNGIIRCIKSIYNQVYADWDLQIFVSSGVSKKMKIELERISEKISNIRIHNYIDQGQFCEALNSAVQAVSAEWIIFSSARQSLAPHALAEITLAISDQPQTPFFYADEDHIDESGCRSAPVFKPGWDKELLRSYNYVGDFICCRKASLDAIGQIDSHLGHGALFHILSALADAAPLSPPVRIPLVLSHRMPPPSNIWGIQKWTQSETEDEIEARKRYLRRTGTLADVGLGALGTIRIRYRFPSEFPVVSVIIPTRDRVELLRQAVEGLINDTIYNALEIIIVDNDSVEQETLDYLSELEARKKAIVLRMKGEFNYSKFNNVAATHASGSILCFLNNDIKVIHPDWLEEMASRAVQSDTGAVGAKLLYENGTVQHSGIILGVRGTAAHAFRFERSDLPGPLGRLQIPHTKSAVTGACLVVERRKFFEVGGFDEENLKINYNDVDLCLKLYDAGYKNIFTPYATLYHLESASRGGRQTRPQLDQARKEVTYFQNKWQSYILNDPYYSPNLTKISEDYSISE